MNRTLLFSGSVTCCLLSTSGALWCNPIGTRVTLRGVDITIWYVGFVDFDQIIFMDEAVFGMHYEPEDVEVVLFVVDLVRFLVATEVDCIVGVIGDYPFSMIVFGGVAIEVCGVIWVSVSLIYCCCGIFVELMRCQLGEFVDAGVLVVILTVSEFGIYGCYGYGLVFDIWKVSIDCCCAWLIHLVDFGLVVLVIFE